MEIVVHIGTHKTATTSIQAALKESRSSLERVGVGLLSIPTHWHDVQLMETLRGDLVEETRKEVANAFRAKPGLQRWVWSWEGFSGNPLDAYRNAPVLASFLKQVAAGCELELIVFLRRQDTFVESMYNFSIKVGHSWSFREFLAIYEEQALDWCRFLNHYRKTLPNARFFVKSYDHCKEGGSSRIIEHFFSLLRVPLSPDSLGGAPRNVGLRRDALEVVRLTNELLSKDERHAMKRMLARVPVRDSSDVHGFFPSRDAVECFLRPYHECNRRLSREYFNGEPAFAHSIAERAPYPGLTTEDVCRVLAPLLVEQELNHIKLSETNHLYVIRIARVLESMFRRVARKAPRLRAALKKTWSSLEASLR